MTLRLAPTETLRFLTQWFTHCPTGQFAEVRPLNKRPNERPLARAWFDDLRGTFNHVSDCVANGDDVYIGALPRVRRGGKAEDVGSHRWLWCDVDYGSEGHAKAAPYGTREDALTAIERFRPAPTMVVDTGGGFHVWWALAVEPEVDVWRDAIRRAAHALHADTNALDAPRILRVPGTFNLKSAPRPVVVVSESDGGIAIEDFLRLPARDDILTLPASALLPTARPFDQANGIPIADVLAWLGARPHREGDRTYCACPAHGGHNESQMIVGGDANSAHCFGDCDRSYTPVDLVAAAHRVSPRDAVNLLAEHFGFAGLRARARATDAGAVPSELARASATEAGAAPSEPPSTPTPPAAPSPAECAGDWTDLLDWKLDKHGKRRGLYPGVKNTSLILLNDPAWTKLLAYDEFLQSVIARREPPCLEWARPTTSRRASRLTEDDYSRARLWIADKYRVSVSRDCIYESVAKIVAKTQAYHPVREYLTSLEGRWDGAPRVETFAKTYLGSVGLASTEANFIRWFLLSAVARVFEPGCKADSTLILEGAQGLGKSTAIRILGGGWVADSPIQIGTKDAFIALAGVWIAELAELESLLRSDPDAVKAFLSSPVDRYRPPYARDAEDFPRQCVFAGTVNHFEYLKDPTGARRFWPILCARIDLGALTRDRDQIWAETMHLYRAGTKWWPSSPEEVAACERVQETRYQADAWEEKVREYLLAPMTDASTLGVRVDEILREALHVATRDHDRTRQARVVAILERLGFVPARPRRPDGTRPRAYAPPTGWPKTEGAHAA
jgi:predicted P-loop ATPase